MADLTDPTVLLENAQIEGVQALRINRPAKANALDASTVDQFHGCLDQVGLETRVLLVTGAGRTFCGGFDFGGYEGQSQGDLLLRFVRINELLSRLRNARYVTVAWVNGPAIGAGADIACACLVRLGTSRARLRFPGYQFGLALGTQRLAEVMGAMRARDILMRNQELDSYLALELGLLGQMVEEEDLWNQVRKVANSIRLEGNALATLVGLTSSISEDSDLANLVRTASTPGIHARIARFHGLLGRLGADEHSRFLVGTKA